MRALAPEARAKEAHERRVLTIGTALDDYANGFIDADAAVKRMARAGMDATEARRWVESVRKDVRFA